MKTTPVPNFFRRWAPALPFAFILLILLPALLVARQTPGPGGLDPQSIGQPSPDSWPTYDGDYTGQRFRSFDQINRGNVSQLSLAWAFQTGAPQPAGMKATPLLVHGVLYFSEPDNVWAVDARTGRQLWHYQYPPNPGLHIGQRGVAMWQDRIYMETPNAHLICLDARNGKLLWDVVMADARLGYWATTAPLVIRNHVIVGISGDDNDLRGFVAAYDPVTGTQQWRWWSTPEEGDPAASTWPNADTRLHGGGMTWITGTYDPELNLLYWGTANATPVMDGSVRPGNNLYTCSIVALNPDTGKLTWGFQATPHDVHDYDAVQTPVLVNGTWQGQPRRLLIQADRNGYFFVLDRVTGKNLLSRPYTTVSWSKGVNADGQPIPDPDRMPTKAGTLVQPDADGATNWWAPSYDPQTGLLYVNSQQSASIYYVTAQGKPAGFAGTDAELWTHSWLQALDYHTGTARWKYDLGPGSSGVSVLTTGGGLVFTADTHGNMLALDAVTGKRLWHSYGGNMVDNAPITYILDGQQYVLYAAQDVFFAFRLPPALPHH